MKCNKPITLTIEGYPKIFPCGKCKGCRSQRKNEIALRLLHEQSYHDESIFITLTYNEKNVPKTNYGFYTLRRKDLTNYIKKLRKEFNRPIKFFGCGEYGEKFDRPHYHLIIFGIGQKEKDVLQKKWEHGFIDIGLAEYQSMLYVAKYINKKLSGKLLDELTSYEIEDTFSIFSNGIGKQYCLDNSDQITQQGYCTARGIKYSIPRYYIKLLGIKQSTDVKKNSECELVEHYTGIYCTLDQLYLSDSDLYLKYSKRIISRNNQREKNLDAKIKK